MLLIYHTRDVLMEKTKRAAALMKGAGIELTEGTPALTDDDRWRFLAEVHALMPPPRNPDAI